MLLPTPIKWMKKILSVLKSNLSPNQIAFSVCLGAFAGLPPLGLHVLIPITLALLFRCSFRSFLLSVGLFKLLSLVTAPLSYAIGSWLLDPARGLDGFWRWLFHLPVLAPMGYSRYLLLGSVVVALALAIPSFLVVRFLVERYRVSFSIWVSEWRISSWLRGRRGLKVARYFFAGGEAKYDVEPPPKGIFRIVRRGMLVGIPVLYALAYLMAAIVIPFFAGTLATSTASWIVGSDVSVSDSQFSLFSGSLTLTDLEIQDPKAPSENLIVVPEIRLDAGMLALVSKRVVFDSVVISDATMHVKRESDGTLNIDNPSSGWDADGYVEWALQHAGQVDWLGVLRQFFRYLGKWELPSPREDPYAAYAGERSFPAFRPPFAVRKLEIGRLLITLEDQTEEDSGTALPPLTMFEIEVSNLAFPEKLRTEPLHVALRGQWGDDPESGFELSMTVESSEWGSAVDYTFAVRRIDLPRLARIYATTLPVRIASGLASVSGTVRMDAEASSGDVSVLLESLRLDPETDHPLFGLPVTTSDAVIEGINRYSAEAPIVLGAGIGGTREAPKLLWEAPLLAVAREGLMMAGRRELDGIVNDLGERVDALGGSTSAALDPGFAAIRDSAESTARAAIEEAADDLLPDLPRINSSGQEAADGSTEGTDTSDLIPTLLDSLFHRSAPSAQADSEGDDGL